MAYASRWPPQRQGLDNDEDGLGGACTDPDERHPIVCIETPVHPLLAAGPSINDAGAVAFAGKAAGGLPNAVMVSNLGSTGHRTIIIGTLFSFLGPGGGARRPGRRASFRLYNYALTSFVELAGASNGFTVVGRSPGTSGEGAMVVSYGEISRAPGRGCACWRCAGPALVRPGRGAFVAAGAELIRAQQLPAGNRRT